jgi:hypothetical protein
MLSRSWVPKFWKSVLPPAIDFKARTFNVKLHRRENLKSSNNSSKFYRKAQYLMTVKAALKGLLKVNEVSF